VATLLERDNDIPAFAVLYAEATEAAQRLQACTRPMFEAEAA
jgi:uncharacterized protein (UPF0276 family)